MTVPHKYCPEHVNAASTAGFDAMYTIARNGVKKKWRKMSTTDRLDAARALVYMRDVARDHKKYLSRATTEAAWRERAKAYAAEQGTDEFHAYYIVQTPDAIVAQNSAEALAQTPYLWKNFYNFSESVRQYDYYLTSADGYTAMLSAAANTIYSMSEHLTDRAQEISARPTVRWLYKLRNNFRQY